MYYSSDGDLLSGNLSISASNAAKLIDGVNTLSRLPIDLGLALGPEALTQMIELVCSCVLHGQCP